MTSTVLITGGNRGIGLEIVRGFAKEGCKVLLGCRNEDDGLAAKKDIVGADIQVIELNLNNEQQIIESVTRAQAIYGDIDILVNNAGFLEDNDWQNVELEEIKRAMQVHVYGPLCLIQQVLPAMVEKNYGRIVNLSSGYGSFEQGINGPTAYSVSKAALNALTVNIANSVDAANVKINSMTPGWVHTRLGGKDAPRTPEEGAKTAVWLGLLEDDGPTGKFFRDQDEISW
ncbi:SDR family NAD(P)-dependent oxidoreductase [Alteromonas sp. C1M14]|uniref:SDR family NAD(P)-dependent oxidoreductase n=1 Tax=Alteromonas sp. C1M14 TaxID=2841567 RepID=UPI001C094707|nr:SDR family NAD(P)-dependent oxidoreductase [Alteromonas sp. C1M14]MBU2977004.1 SDR family NAD(P)-dependent oxidoreductase [Alteromonas sp. C1M14]